MTVSAHDVAAVLRERLPGLTGLKLHKLLYYTQAHHLAAAGEPLFAESVLAWDKGPVVGALWTAEKNGDAPPPRRPLAGGQLNIVDYVVSRYGELTGPDLMHLTHGETPWKTANATRDPGGSVRIRNEWMRDYFRDEPHDEGEVWFTREKVAELTAGAEERLRAAGPPDPASNDRLWAFFDEQLGGSRA
uniref:Panacea domain-containing protein n=1 Tax=Paractinoplanes polyasparticus TaxID=2856853 RepID=UPI001C85F2F3|nr:type II toxin-antitoxin system antitoxin SocA domain-containing protein [Actinoplanes polyasparticus]